MAAQELTCISAPVSRLGMPTGHAASGAPSLRPPDRAQSIIALAEIDRALRLACKRRAPPWGVGWLVLVTGLAPRAASRIASVRRSRTSSSRQHESPSVRFHHSNLSRAGRPCPMPSSSGGEVFFWIVHVRSLRAISQGTSSARCGLSSAHRPSGGAFPTE